MIKKLNKQDKDWIFRKIIPLRKIFQGIVLTLEITDLYLDKEMVNFLKKFIMEIHGKMGVD